MGVHISQVGKNLSKRIKIVWVFRTEGVLGPRVQMNTAEKSPRSLSTFRQVGKDESFIHSVTLPGSHILCYSVEWRDANTQSLPSGDASEALDVAFSLLNFIIYVYSGFWGSSYFSL